jgi:hypothetical protein
MEKMTPVWTDDFSRREDRIGADEAGKRSAEIVDTDVWPPSADENEEPLAPSSQRSLQATVRKTSMGLTWRRGPMHP